VVEEGRARPQNRLDAGLNSLLVRTGKKNILIETGIGNKLPEKLVQIYKQPAKLLDNLHAAGVAPEDIDIVINTHLHFDHCGWNTVRHGDQVVATFPRRSITCSGKSGSMAASNSNAMPSAT
jgi:glyoxylase-like metal-dependent hydrolase (beta-lactamase superfamily II)